MHHNTKRPKTTKGIIVVPPKRAKREVASTSLRGEVSPLNEAYCKTCEDVVPCERQPGAGPHEAKLACIAHGHLIKWLPKERTPEELARRAAQDRLRRMTIPPTSKQLAFLTKLGADLTTIKNCEDAHQAIDALLKGRWS